MQFNCPCRITTFEKEKKGEKEEDKCLDEDAERQSAPDLNLARVTN